jgi:hypothetical protein
MIIGLSIDLSDERIIKDASQSPLVLDNTAYLDAYSLCVQYDPDRLNKIDYSKSN